MIKDFLKKGLWVLVFRVLGAFLAFLMVVVFARVLGADQFGLYSLALTIVTVLSVLVRAGIDNVVLKQVSAHMPDMKQISNGYIYSSIVLVTIIGIIVSALLWSVSFQVSEHVFSKPELARGLQLFAIVIVPLSLVYITAEIMKGLGKVAYSAFVQAVLTSLITLIIAAVLWLLSEFTLYVAILAFIGGYSSVAIFNLLKLKPFFFSKYRSKVSFTSLIKEGWPMLLASSGAMVMAWSDVIVIGLYLDEAQVGVYSAASKTVMTTVLLLVAINSLTAPKFARYYKKRNIQAVKDLAQISSLILLVTASVATLVLLVFPNWIMSWFGSDFVVGANVLMILAIGQFVNVACGSVGYLLTMTGREHTMRNIMLTTAALNITLSVLLVQIYGVTGVAYATTLSTMLWNIWSMIEVKKHLGFWTFMPPNLFK